MMNEIPMLQYETIEKPIYTAKTQKFRKSAIRKNAKDSLRILRCNIAKAQKIYFAILRLRLCGFLRFCGVRGSFSTLSNWDLGIGALFDIRHFDFRLSTDGER